MIKDEIIPLFPDAPTTIDEVGANKIVTLLHQHLTNTSL
jgi:hypothetical protein